MFDLITAECSKFTIWFFWNIQNLFKNMRDCSKVFVLGGVLTSRSLTERLLWWPQIHMLQKCFLMTTSWIFRTYQACDCVHNNMAQFNTFDSNWPDQLLVNKYHPTQELIFEMKCFTGTHHLLLFIMHELPRYTYLISVYCITAQQRIEFNLKFIYEFMYTPYAMKMALRDHQWLRNWWLLLFAFFPTNTKY